MTATLRGNASLVRRFLTDAVDGGATNAVSVFLADGVVNHNLVFEDGQDREKVTALDCRVLAAADGSRTDQPITRNRPHPVLSDREQTDSEDPDVARRARAHTANRSYPEASLTRSLAYSTERQKPWHTLDHLSDASFDDQLIETTCIPEATVDD